MRFSPLQGRRKEPVPKDKKPKSELYHIRSNGGILAKRVMQVCSMLCHAFICLILENTDIKMKLRTCS